MWETRRSAAFSPRLPLQQRRTGERNILTLKIGVKVVDTIGEAIGHINKYNSGHSEAIVTNSYANSQKFLDEIDAAAVYVNASTRFTDGFEFGFGAEIGISTQKTHARGPMGLTGAHLDRVQNRGKRTNQIIVYRRT